MRKHTIFEPCDRHVNWYASERRYRRAEVMAEGGYAHNPCQPGQQCQMKPGTDFFTEDFIRDNPVYKVKNRPAVWLAEETIATKDMYGVYSTGKKAKAACQRVAEMYYGPHGTPPLQWKDGPDGGYSSAAYTNPAGNYSFHVTEFVVDGNEERELY